MTHPEKTYATGISYHPHGAMKTLAFGNNIVETYLYNSRLQPHSMDATPLGGSSVWALSNHYCPNEQASCSSNNGNVLSQSLSMPKTDTGTLVTKPAFAYDAVNRITSAAEQWDDGGAWTDSWSRSYSYGPTEENQLQYGNVRITGSAGSEVDDLLTCGIYDTGNNRCSDGRFGYDNAGNVTQYGTSRTLAYDAENRQVSLTDSGTTFNYSYDGEGRRVKKVIGDVTTVYVYDVFGSLAAEYSTSVPKNQAGCETCYLTVDHLGSTRMMTDENGDIVRRYDYYPFGQSMGAGQGNRTSVTGYVSGSDWTNPRFSAKLRDYESGLNLDYSAARYYSGSMGRFTSPDDPFVDQHPLDPQSWNLYSYVRNSPLTSIDLSGRSCVTVSDGNGNESQADDGDGKGCAAAGVAPSTAEERAEGEDIQPSDTEVSAPPSSLLAYLFAPAVPRYMENDRPLSEDARQTMSQVGRSTQFIPDAGDKVGACMAERFFGVPLAAGGAAGAVMVAAGQPVLPTRAKFGSNPTNILGQQPQMHPSILVDKGLPTKGTSVASRASRATLGRGVGRAVGRAVPVVGWVLTAADAAAIAACVATK